MKAIDKYSVNCATVSEDGKMVGMCNINGEIGILDVETSTYINKLPMHDLPVQGCAFNSSDDLLFTGSVDYKIGFISPVKRSIVGMALANPIAILAVLLLAVLLGFLFR